MKNPSESCNLCLCLVLALSAILHTGNVHAQQIYTLDLAAPITEQTVAEDSPFKIQIENQVPTARYSISVARDFIQIPPLELPASEPEEAPQLSSYNPDDDCPSRLTALNTALNEAETELEVETSIRSAVRSARRDARENCDEILETLAEDRTARTLSNQYSLARGEVLKVRVQRVSANTDEVQEEFAFALTPGSRGEWRLQYGLTFVPDRNERFFSKQVSGDPSSFTIEQDRVERGKLYEIPYDLIPSLLFTWIPAELRLDGVSPGITGGLGYDLQNLSAFLGVALTFNENVSLTGGFVMHKQSRLRGRYSVGDTLQQSIDRDLLTEEKYYPNWYVGLSFRLSSNPFSRDSDSESDEGATTPGVVPDDNGESNADEGTETENNEGEDEEPGDGTENDDAEGSQEDLFFDSAIVSEGDTVLGFQVTERSLTMHSRSGELPSYYTGTVAFEGEAEIAGFPQLDDNDSLYVELINGELSIPHPESQGTMSHLYFADGPDEIIDQLKTEAEMRSSTEDTPAVHPEIRVMIHNIRIIFSPVETDGNVPPPHSQATLVRRL